MFSSVDVNSQKVFDQNFGDIMPLEEFIECCESGSLIDYDGYASEILLDNKIIFDSSFYPSDVEDHKNELLQLQKDHGQLQVVWYNR